MPRILLSRISLYNQESFCDPAVAVFEKSLPFCYIVKNYSA